MNHSNHGILSIETAVPHSSFQTTDMLNGLQSKLSPLLIDSLDKLGIQNRHACVSNLIDFISGKAERKLCCSTTDLGVAAAEKCLKQINPNDIGLLVAMTNTSDRHLPCFGYEIQNKLLHHSIPSDINILSLENEGCSALLKGIETADNYLSVHPEKLALLVAAEGHTGFFTPLIENCWSLTELKQKNASKQEFLKTMGLITSFLFGDGAVAILLGADGNKGNFDTIKHLTNIDQQDIHVIYMNEGGMLLPTYEGYPNYILTSQVPERGKVYADKITQMIFSSPDSVITDPDDADYFMIHTGSKKILDVVKEKIKHSHGKSSISYEILNQYGNLSTCSVGFMLEKCIKNHAKGKGLIVSFGVGFSASASTFLFSKHKG